MTVAFLLTTMPCANGLLAPNMSVMAAQAVKDHMRNSHFTGEDPRKQTRFWQLYNHCSHGYLQTYYKTVNARGKPGSKCLIDFKVVSDTFGGRVRLQHALSGKYLCFNRRRRVTVRDGSSARCEFVEHLNDAGYTEIESAWTPGLFLGFNRKGRFQDPRRHSERRRCFAYTKFSRDVEDVGGSRLAQCSGGAGLKSNTTTTTTTMPSAPPIDEQRLAWNAMRNSFLNKVRATVAPVVSSTTTPPSTSTPSPHPHRHHRRRRYWR